MWALIFCSLLASPVESLDLSRIYTTLRSGPESQKWTQVLKRSSVDSLTTLSYSVSKNTTVWQLPSPLPPRGVFAALGPSRLPVWPAAAPKNARDVVQVSVLPDKMWLVGESIAAGIWPLEYSLLRFHLGAVEADIGKSWIDDMLGHTPQAWTLVRSGPSGETFLAELGVQDGTVGTHLLQPLIAMAREVVEDLNIRTEKIGAQQVFHLKTRRGSLLLTFKKKHLVLASDMLTLKKYLQRAGSDTPLKNLRAPAVAYGQLKSPLIGGDATMRTLLQQSWSVVLGSN